MNKKLISIIFFSSILMLLVPTGSAEWTNGTIDVNIDTTTALTVDAGIWNWNPEDITYSFEITDDALCGKPKGIVCKYMFMSNVSSIMWDDIPLGVGSSFTLDGGQYSGAMTVYRTSAVGAHGRGEVHIDFHDEMDLNVGQEYPLTFADLSIFEFYYDMISFDHETNDYESATFGYEFKGYNSLVSQYAGFSPDIGSSNDYYYTYSGRFVNEYNINIEEYLGISNITRDLGYDFEQSAFIIKDELGSEVYNSGYLDTNNSYNHGNNSQSYWLRCQANSVEYLLLQNYVDVPGAPTLNIPKLESDDQQYILNDDIEFNYTKLNYIDIDTDVIYDLITYTYEASNIKVLTTQSLSGGYDQNTGTAYFSSINYPYGAVYFSVIDTTLEYYNDINIIQNNEHLKDVLYILPVGNAEFINITNNVNYLNNGDKIYYSYYAKNDTSVYINDSSDECIQMILINSGFGEGEYFIPYDDTQSFNYPSWDITMNESSDAFTVYWIEQVIAEYNEHINYTMDDDVTENVESIREAVDPIKDLLFGMSTIFIENPDYDQNGIVDMEEISDWLNGIVTILIVVLLYIFYKALKRR